jgi:small subunit ribosomal protein S20
MPVIQSAKKRAKQQKVRTERNRHFKSRMMTLFKNIIKWAKGGEVEKAEGFLNETQKAIDIAAKKNIIHKNTANRRKSAISKAILDANKRGLEGEGAIVKKTSTKAKAKSSSAKINKKKSDLKTKSTSKKSSSKTPKRKAS